MFFQDLRYAARAVVRNRAFTALAALCLAVGIGVDSTIFSVVNGVVLRPFPYHDADRIIVLDSANQRLDVRQGGISYADFEDLRDQSTTPLSIAAFSGRSLTISDRTSEPERYLGSTISWNLFELRGTPPTIGRNFTPDDDRPGAEPVVLLSHDIWQRRYAGDASIVGRAVSIDGRPHTVVGAMPPRLAFPEIARLWVPLAHYGDSRPRTERSLEIFARLKPDATPDQAETDLKSLAARLAAAHPDANRDWTVSVRALSDWMLPEDVKLIVLTMMGAATLVLLIACANVANLLLARASVRHREISIRAALGAGRWRIIRQLLTEAVIIGLLSSPLGIVVAIVGLRLLDALLPGGRGLRSS